MAIKKIRQQIIYAEQLKLVASAMPLSLFTTLIIATLLALLQSEVIDPTVVTVWYSGLVASCTVLYFSSRRYQQKGGWERNPVYWGNLFFIGVVFSGALWGAAAFFLFPFDSQSHQLILAFVLAGMVTGSVTTLSSVNLYFQSFAMLSLLPLAARFVQTGEALDLAMAVMITIYLIMVSISAWRVHRTILVSLDLVFAHERTNEALQDADDHNRLLLESAAEGIFGVDEHGITTFVNPSAASILGYAPWELIGQSMHELIHHHRIDGTPYPISECPMSATLRTGDHYYIDNEVLWHKKGHSIPVEYNSTPILKNEHVVGAVITFSDISQRLEAESKLEYQAYFDGLTALANRRLLLDRLEQALSRSHYHSHMGGLLLLDLDDFKNINDSLGHRVGDELLCEIAHRLQRAVRTEDTVARMGGDDFVILLPEVDDDPETTAKHVQEIAEKCRDAIARPIHVNGHELHVTVSVGVALFPMGGETADDLLKQADTAMYRAKEEGRDTIQFFLPSMQLAVEERMMLYNDLRQALSRDELELYYQAQFDTSGNVVGAEALLRWRHPERGIVPPGEFIALAEDSGLILPIGEWVMLSACRLLSQLEAAGKGDLLPVVAVNVSPRQFRQPSFVPYVMAILAETDVDASRLELELTEGTLVEDIEDTVEKMEALQALGVRFSIDDFGTGYSSLAYLQQLPLHKLKVDQSFVRNIQTEHNSEVLVDTIIVMGKHLNLTVIAEGVENDNQLQSLCGMGCDQFQGFLFSRPQDETHFLGQLAGSVVQPICH